MCSDYGFVPLPAPGCCHSPDRPKGCSALSFFLDCLLGLAKDVRLMLIREYLLLLSLHSSGMYVLYINIMRKINVLSISDFDQCIYDRLFFYVYTIFSENSLMGGFVDWWARNEDGF